MQQFFYDAQIRRFLLQFTRIFSGFQIEYGNETDGVNKATLLRVPVRYGDSSRNAQTIIQENSASALPSTPLMTFYINNLEYDRPSLYLKIQSMKFLLDEFQRVPLHLQ